MKTPDQIYDEFEARQATKKRKAHLEGLNLFWRILTDGFRSFFISYAVPTGIISLLPFDGANRKHSLIIAAIVIVFTFIVGPEVRKLQALEALIEALEKKIPNADSGVG